MTEQKWRMAPVEATPEMYSASRLVTESEGITTTTWLRSAVYRAMLEASPQPPRLSDERIREIWIEHGLDDEDVEGFARAIEREIISGGKAE